MNILVTLAALIVFPIAVGYLRGHSNVDPRTPEGVRYYK